MFLEGLLCLLLAFQDAKKVDSPQSPKSPAHEVVVKSPSKSLGDALTDKNASEILGKSSVRVSCSQIGGRVGHGSGTVMNKNGDVFHVLTCSHVADPAVSGGILRVRYGSKESHAAKLLVYCPVRDLALLECKGTTEAVAAVVAPQDDYKAGSALFRCGYPFNGTRKVVRGKVLPVQAWTGMGGHRVLIATPPSISGDSGGGIFRASDGKLVGVNYASDGRQSMTAARLEGIWKTIKYSEIKMAGDQVLPMPTPVITPLKKIETKKEK